MDLFQISAIAAGMLLVVAGLPQLLKIIKTKVVKDLALPMFLLFFMGQAVWLVYGIHISDKPIIISNAASMTVNFSIIYLILKYRNAKDTD